jgi:hypothetical protein
MVYNPIIIVNPMGSWYCMELLGETVAFYFILNQSDDAIAPLVGSGCSQVSADVIKKSRQLWVLRHLLANR